MEDKLKKFVPYIAGFVAGILNGLLGAGGGMVTVSMLSHFGVDQRKSHAISVAILFPICILSSIIYIYSGKVTIQDSSPYLLWGILGSIAGAFILSRINENTLRGLFGIIVVYSGFRMLIR